MNAIPHSNPPAFFVGYFDLEEWAAWTRDNAGKQINACLYRHPGTDGALGNRVDQLVIETSQIWDGQAHYCRIQVGNLAYVNNQPFDPDAKARFDRAQSAYALVEEWLLEQGFHLRNTMIAKPRDFTYVDGYAGFLRYDKEQKQYVRQHA